MSDAPWTVRRLLDWTAGYFGRLGLSEARLSAEVLLAHVLACKRIELYTRFDAVPDEPSLARFRELVKRAGSAEPIAYLVGEREFYSLPIRVTREVLIPRPETETLVERVIDHCRALSLKEPKLLDLGTGSGCIAVAVLRHVPGARVVASDVSSAALNIARENAERHGVHERMTLAEADRLALPAEVIPAGGFDVIMSNPPYIGAGDVGGLEACIRDFEPHAALTDGEDGLSFYRMLAEDSAALLAPGGAVFVEIGNGQAAEVIRLMTAGGKFEHCRTWKDPVVGAERVLWFRKSHEATMPRSHEGEERQQATGNRQPATSNRQQEEGA
ncbi:MAG: peptide chain release factor N(5)-glutamine methyltransferase [Phycisphaerae bacterium]|nr:peptide chain release factor N(5)-glutamine methyltransferase [Phycisphaerae bacterium]